MLYDVDQMTPSTLAKRMKMTEGAISMLADRRLAKGFIGRTQSPGDKRTHSLFLSKPGRHKIPGLATLADKNDAQFFGVLMTEECNALGRLLKSLVERQGSSNVPAD